MEDEMARGLLGLYGRGEAHDQLDGAHSPSSTAQSPECDVASPATS